MPESFDELTGKQLLRLVKLMRPANKDDHRLKVLRILLIKSLYYFFRMPADAKDRMLHYVEWVFEENTLTQQLLPVYKGFYGPKAEFDNLTVGEFHFTEMFYRLLSDGDNYAVNKLIAVLYRKSKKNYDISRDIDGDVRTAFNANEIEYFAKKINRWPDHVKVAILMWYDGCRQHMVQLYDKCFSGRSSDNDDRELGMYNVIRNLSGNKFGTIKEVEKIFIHNAFLEIEKIIEENEEAEKQLKKVK